MTTDVGHHWLLDEPGALESDILALHSRLNALAQT